ncbi:MAG: hypothetical protein QOD00_1858 [Blastocatellia bacterium]|jgi:SpoVK/Ycf46/Vps4 family AAA+-type ATPase|nr:hypothetical protein [Blastocatellia bacterium]
MGKSTKAALAKKMDQAATGSSNNELLGALERLDQLIGPALGSAQALYGPEAASDPHRGLYIGQSDIDRLLARPAGLPLSTGSSSQGKSLFHKLNEYPSGLTALAEMYGLSGFDLDLMIIALAPELDLRYERVYAYLQDDVTRRHPSVDLALNLLCSTAEAKLARRAHFGSDAPLVQHGLVQLLADPAHLRPPLLSHYIKLEDQVVRFLLGQKSLDARLVSCCRLISPSASLASLHVSEEVKRALPVLLAETSKSGQPLKLYFQGPKGARKMQAAEAIAQKSKCALLIVDVGAALASAMDFEQLSKLIFREAGLQGALLYLDGMDALLEAERAQAYKQLLVILRDAGGVTIMAGEAALGKAAQVAGRVLEVNFPRPNFTGRRASWQDSLHLQGVKLNQGDLDALAGRFRLTHGEIESAVNTAANRSLWRKAAQGARSSRSHDDGRPELLDLFAAARDQSSNNLSNLARKIQPKYAWKDIILPPDQLDQLTEICNRAKYRHIVSGEWGFARKQSLGNGLNALFSGPPGTGKTMAAEVIANELHLDLYKIDLSQVVSKYIGETEKNLDRIFHEAQTSFSILFFDEADALFGKRSEVNDAHDRYANIEVGYLLQKMEEYDGIAILATNLRQNMDEAFLRRMHVILEFTFPDENYRKSIWQSIFPGEAPLHKDVDFERLAREIKLAGGNIKNIAMTAAYYAASNGRHIRMSHLMQAARREFQKLGRAWSETQTQ